MRLLLAEDEKALSRVLVKILEKNNFSVDPVYDGEEAISYLESGEYDAAILDIMMPKADGITVLKTIRAQGNSIPVIMLTAKAEVDDKVLGLDAGANDYLAKPFDSRELLARIRAMTRKKENTDSELSFGNTRLNRANYELTGPKCSFRLTGKEYQLMELLMLNSGRLIPSERMFENIWGCDSEAEINVVWVYISYLRKKLAAMESDIEIRASRGTGYTLEIKTL